MKNFICVLCGHVEFEKAPGNCPVCSTVKFYQNDDVFTDSVARSKEAEAKHVPAITVKTECKMVPDAGCVDVLVTIGKVPHPMEPVHHILFIDCYVDSRFVSRANLTPYVNAAACFHLKAKGTRVTIVSNCNIHGFWTAEASIG